MTAEPFTLLTATGRFNAYRWLDTACASDYRNLQAVHCAVREAAAEWCDDAAELECALLQARGAIRRWYEDERAAIDCAHAANIADARWAKIFDVWWGG